MPKLTPKQIIIAPLDWGLGHTTRCVPVIRHIKALGHNPIFVGNASQQRFITDTFGAIDTIDLPGYNITYSKWNRFAQAGLLLQLPAIRKAISNEHEWLQQLAQHRHIDGVIADNRYGLHHPSIPCAIMTHQLLVQSAMGNAIDRAVQALHYKYLQRFNSTWVIDMPGSPNLSGKLAHPTILPKHTKYVGLLSRFGETQSPNANDGHLLILLSGPEPARSSLSAVLWQQIQQHTGKVVFVEGSDDVTVPSYIPPHITCHKRLTHTQLAPLLTGAGMVICRSGYSTIMDLIALGKKAILIPTPGQTEQEYLARHLHAQGIFYAQKEQGFELAQALRAARQFPFQLPVFAQAFTKYKEVLADWLGNL